MLAKMVFASRVGCYLFSILCDLSETDSSCCLDEKQLGKAVNEAFQFDIVKAEMDKEWVNREPETPVTNLRRILSLLSSTEVLWGLSQGLQDHHHVFCRCRLLTLEAIIRRVDCSDSGTTDPATLGLNAKHVKRAALGKPALGSKPSLQHCRLASLADFKAGESLWHAS